MMVTDEEVRSWREVAQEAGQGAPEGVVAIQSEAFFLHIRELFRLSADR